MENSLQDIHLQNNETQNSEIKKRLGLSNSPNLTAILFTKKYVNGEGSIRIVNSGNSICKIRPPLQSGQRICNRISSRARRKIKLACRMFQFHAKENKLICCLITLTYGNDFPDDITAKKHLDSFLKRIHRLKQTPFFVWVAEKQKRNAIHFHILTDYTDKAYVNSAWNEIVQRWQRNNGFQLQTLLPNVKGISYPANYLSKYLTKGNQKIRGNIYGISYALRKLTKPVLEVCQSIPSQLLLPVLEEALSSFPEDSYKRFQGSEMKLIWSKQNIHILSGNILTIINNIQYDKTGT